MLLDVLSHFSGKRIILASTSPRRIELLKRLGLTFEVIPSTFSENLPKDQFPTATAYAQETCNHKALEVWNRLTATATKDPTPTTPPPFLLPDIIIAADSVVESSSHEILEKPKDKTDCYRMIQALSNSHSMVHTGVCILVRNKAFSTVNPFSSVSSFVLPFSIERSNDSLYTLLKFTDTTRVSFAALPSSLIERYSLLEEPYDKAGGYGIQALAGSFITGIEGCYYNVMGFPLYKISHVLRTLVDHG